jgi:serine/threonine-protein kinase
MSSVQSAGGGAKTAGSLGALAPKLCATCGARYPADALFCPSDGTPLQSSTGVASDPGEAPDPYLGREISGHIEVRQLVGVGAMGRVYRAFQKGIDRDVAVKILHRELSANQQLVTRFHREAKVASRLQHPNVVAVHLAGQLPDGAMYIVMEYLDGLSLQSALAAASGAMPLPRALHIALQLCDAVGEAHAQGVVHRDLKPENVMLVRRGEDTDYVKVLDFGIARLNWGEQSMATAAGLIFGTARYISPEGAQGEQVGPAGDVYAIATLLYQMLAGRTPFEGEQAVGLLIQQIHDAPPPLRSLPRAAAVPDPIAAVVMDNLAKDQAARAPDARALGRDLIDAAKACGFSPEDLVGRPGLLSGRSSPMKLPSMQKTNQLQLDSDSAARLGGIAAAAPSSRRVLPDEPSAPAAPTTKWSPPANFAAKLRAEAGQAAFPAPAVSSVEKTMDDDDAPAHAVAPPRVAGSRPGGTEYGEPGPSIVSSRPPPARIAPPPSKPPSGVDTTLSDEDHARLVRRRWTRGFALILLCFVAGAGIAAGLAWKMGKLEPAAQTSSVDETVHRANEALKKDHFVEPPGDNVRDITDEGLKRWPGNDRLLEIRERAANDLVQQALARRFSGDVVEALRFAKMARELDPGNASAQHLVETYEAELATPFPSNLPAPPQPGVSGKTPAPQVLAYRVILEPSVPRPRVGQPVEFVARISTGTGAPPRGKPESPTIEIDGPGLGNGVKISTIGDASGAQRATYTFLDAGKYEITFTTKVDGVSLRANRTIVSGEAPQVPATAPTTSPTLAPVPTTSGSVKWL